MVKTDGLGTKKNLRRNPRGTLGNIPHFTLSPWPAAHPVQHTNHHQPFNNKRLITNTFNPRQSTSHKRTMKTNKRNHSMQAINYVPLFQTVSLSGPPQTSPDAALHAIEHPLDAGLWSFSISLPQKHSAPNSVPASVYPAASQILVQAPLDISEPMLARYSRARAATLSV